MSASTQKSYKSSFTLEAVIVMSAILLILCAVLYAFMLLYQNIVTVYAANYAAQQGAVNWINSGIDMETGEGKYKEEIYYRIAEFAETKTVKNKKAKIEDMVKEKLKSGILSPKKSDIKVEFKNYVVQRQVQVEITQELPIPFSGIIQFFGGGKPFEISTKAVAVVPEPAEYIRNIDYIGEIATSLLDWVKEKLNLGSDGEAANKMEDALKTVK